jgi:hypothetical protein
MLACKGTVVLAQARMIMGNADMAISMTVEDISSIHVLHTPLKTRKYFIFTTSLSEVFIRNVPKGTPRIVGARKNGNAAAGQVPIFACYA